MNAPNTAAQLSPFARLPINLITPSHTDVQDLRRSHFDRAKIDELAESIKTQGLLQPILVRPMVVDAEKNPTGLYEIVAGERRWLAASQAGLSEIDCHIRELTDAQLLEAQLVENLQREGVHPLEEAVGYRELTKLRNITPETLAAEIGKSRAYVYARLKLLDLCPEARQALDHGDLDASKALVVARFGPKLQAKIIKDYRSGANERTSYRSFVESVRSMFMTDLTAAPFELTDEALHKFVKVRKGVEEAIALPACVNCPNYSRNDLELQAEFGTDAHVCINRECHDIKVVSFHDRLRLQAKNAGRTILTGDEAKAAIPGNDWMCGSQPGINAKWVRLDAICRDDVYENTCPEPSKKSFKSDEEYEAACEAWQEKSDDYESRTFRALLQPLDPSLIQLAEDSKRRLVELYPVDIAAKILAKQHIEIDVPKPERAKPTRSDDDGVAEAERIAAEFAKQDAKRQQELELRRRVLRQIHAKWKGGLKREDLVIVAESLEACMDSDTANECYDKPVNVTKLNEAELARYIILLIASEELTNTHHANQQLASYAKRLKIDPAKIRKEILAEQRAKDKGTPAPAAAKAVKKGKK